MKPAHDLLPNTFEFETRPLVKPTGFREYDARWWFGHPASGKPPELNLLGVQALGMGLGTLIRRLGAGPEARSDDGSTDPTAIDGSKAARTCRRRP